MGSLLPKPTHWLILVLYFYGPRPTNQRRSRVVCQWVVLNERGRGGGLWKGEGVSPTHSPASDGCHQMLRILYWEPSKSIKDSAQFLLLPLIYVCSHFNIFPTFMFLGATRLDKPARLIIRLLFGFVSDSVFDSVFVKTEMLSIKTRLSFSTSVDKIHLQ